MAQNLEHLEGALMQVCMESQVARAEVQELQEKCTDAEGWVKHILEQHVFVHQMEAHSWGDRAQLHILQSHLARLDPPEEDKELYELSAAELDAFESDCCSSSRTHEGYAE